MARWCPFIFEAGHSLWQNGTMANRRSNLDGAARARSNRQSSAETEVSGSNIAAVSWLANGLDRLAPGMQGRQTECLIQPPCNHDPAMTRDTPYMYGQRVDL